MAALAILGGEQISHVVGGQGLLGILGDRDKTTLTRQSLFGAYNHRYPFFFSKSTSPL